MPNTRSDSRENSAEAYKTTVREFLRAHDEVASKDDLRAGTDVPAWYIDQIAAQDMFYTSLNPKHKYVASKYVVGHRSSHDGFWQPEVDDGVAVFHRKETTKATLKHLVFRQPSGITAPEANDLLDRRCYRALRKLADQQEIHAAEHRNTTVYAHSWPSLRDAQLSQRETDQPTDITPAGRNRFALKDDWQEGNYRCVAVFEVPPGSQMDISVARGINDESAPDRRHAGGGIQYHYPDRPMNSRWGQTDIAPLGTVESEIGNGDIISRTANVKLGKDYTDSDCVGFS